MEAHAYLIQTTSILSQVRELVVSDMNERTIAHLTVKEVCSAIESFLNELGQLGLGYEKSGHNENSKSPNGVIVLLGKKLRKAEEDRKSAKEKIQTAYESLTNKKLAKGNTPAYQKFSLLIDVRNGLIHPKASEIKITKDAMTPPKQDQKMIKRLSSNGFPYAGQDTYDWTNSLGTKKFAVWAYNVTIDIISFILSFWPAKQAIDGFHQTYGLTKIT